MYDELVKKYKDGYGKRQGSFAGIFGDSLDILIKSFKINHLFFLH